MTREYSFVFGGLSSLTTAPFVQLATPATTGIQIIRIELGQEASATSAQAILTAMRRSTASTMPTAVTPLALTETDPASLLAGSTTTNTSGIASVTGTAGNILTRWCFNVLSGLLYVPVPEERITMKPSSFLTLQFPTTPPAVTWSGHIIYTETN